MDATTLGSVFALAAAACWAVAIMFFKHSGEQMSPVALNLFKNVIGVALLLLTLLALGDELPKWERDSWLLLISGVLGVGVADIWMFAGLNRLGASLQAVADGVYAPSVVVWSYLLLGEVLGRWDAVGAALIVGSLLLVSLPKSDAAMPRERLFQGLAYSTGSILLMGFSIVWVKPILEQHGVVYATTVRMLGGLGFLLIYLVFDARERLHVRAVFKPHRIWRVAVPGSVLGTYVSLMLWVAGFKYAPAGVAAILNQTSVLFILLLAACFLKEPLSWRSGVAVGLGFAGSTLVLVS